MPIQHDYYERLGALAVSGQLAHDELATLREHTQVCEECRRILADFRYISSQIVAVDPNQPLPAKVPAQMTSRFIARARSEGVALKYPERSSARLGWFTRPLVSKVVAIVIFTLLAAVPMRHWPARWIFDRAHPSNVIAEVSATRNQDDLIRQLQITRAQLNDSTSRLDSNAAELEAARAEMQRLKLRLATLEQTDLKLQQGMATREVELALLSARRDQLSADLENLRASAKSAEDMASQASRSEIQNLHVQVASLTEELNEREQLSAAAEQAKDLIVARNLHIVDVHDNANGNRPRPFGRIFYTEGQKLIFYAYDLGDARSNAKVSFYVWGEKSGTGEQAKHLGILHADDKRDGRWVVTFDDPQVLAQINTVFVTAESPRKQPSKPNGNRILVAFLDGAPNHP